MFTIGTNELMVCVPSPKHTLTSNEFDKKLPGGYDAE